MNHQETGSWWHTSRPSAFGEGHATRHQDFLELINAGEFSALQALCCALRCWVGCWRPWERRPPTRILPVAAARTCCRRVGSASVRHGWCDETGDRSDNVRTVFKGGKKGVLVFVGVRTHARTHAVRTGSNLQVLWALQLAFPTMKTLKQQRRALLLRLLLLFRLRLRLRLRLHLRLRLRCQARQWQHLQ